MALWWNLSGLVLKPHLRLVSLLSRLWSCHSKASSNSGKGGLVENTLISRSWITIIRCLHGAACQMTQTPRKKREADFHCYLAPLISSLPDIKSLSVCNCVLIFIFSPDIKIFISIVIEYWRCGCFLLSFFPCRCILLLSGSRQITGGDELFDLSAAYMVFTLDYMRSQLSSCLDKLSWWRLHTNYTTNYILKSCFDWLRIFSWTWKNTQPSDTSKTCLKTHFHLLAFKSEWSLSIFTQVSVSFLIFGHFGLFFMLFDYFRCTPVCSIFVVLYIYVQ